jgi:hypothetical protein
MATIPSLSISNTDKIASAENTVKNDVKDDVSSFIDKKTIWSKIKVYVIGAVIFITSLTLIIVLTLILVIMILFSIKKINPYKTS